MKSMYCSFLVVVLTLAIWGCGNKQRPIPIAKPEPKPPAGADEDKAKLAPVPIAAPEATAKADTEKKEEPAPVDDKGTTPARPSLLFGLMLEPSQLLLQSTMDSMRGVVEPFSAMPGVSVLPGLGGGRNAAPAGEASEAKPEEKKETEKNGAEENAGEKKDEAPSAAPNQPSDSQSAE